jgi:site-specific recombinase XerD
MQTALTVAQPVTLRPSYARFNQAVIRKYVDWLGMQGRSRHTLRSFGSHLRDFAAFLEARNILTVEHSDLLAYLSGLYDRGLSKISVVSYIYALRKFQRFISVYGLPNTQAMGRIRLPKVPSRIGDYHSYDVIKKLLAATRTPLERALLEMAFATACRIAELHGMRIERINWPNRTITVIGKGDRERVAYFGEAAESLTSMAAPKGLYLSASQSTTTSGRRHLEADCRSINAMAPGPATGVKLGECLTEG